MNEACVGPIYFSKTTGFLISIAKREPLLEESRNHATFSMVLQTVKLNELQINVHNKHYSFIGN